MQMKFVFSSLVLGLAAALPARADYLCSYKEPSMDLKYMTRIEFLNPDQAAIHSYFITNGQEYPGCTSAEPFTVTPTGAFYELKGRLVCTDKTEAAVVMHLNPMTLQLEVGPHRVEDCVSQP